MTKGKARNYHPLEFYSDVVYKAFNARYAGAIKNVAMFNAVLRYIFLSIFNKVMLDGYEFRYREIGTFSLIKYLPSYKLKEDGTIYTNNIVDVRATVALRREGDKEAVVYYDNSERGDYIYRFYWTKGSVENLRYFKFALFKPLRKLFVEYIFSGKALAREVHFKL